MKTKSLIQKRKIKWARRLLSATHVRAEKWTDEQKSHFLSKNCEAFLHPKLLKILPKLQIKLSTSSLGVIQQLRGPNFEPILTPSPPRVDKRGHFTPPPLVHVDKRGTKAPPP